MKKQGFTLIELMVVIVIMGILAAVAVPKLFGMIAKSKASEVGPAAGTYVKLQEAYFSERNTYGGWQTIGYTAPGTSANDNNGSGHTTNFRYTGGFDKTTTDHQGNANGWQAANKAKLNDCGASSTWTVKVNTPSGNVDSYSATVDGGAACTALTPTFDQIDGTN